MLYFPRPGLLLFALFLIGVIRGTTGIVPCPSTAQSFDVTTTAEATELATALNCSGGGSFDVLWEGTVLVEETFALTDGIVVTIAGVGLGAIVDGNGITQLFTVANSTLNLADIGLANGHSSLAFKHGGAIWAAGVDSVVACSGTIAFSSNSAYKGGAVSIEDGAVGSWSGNMSFIGNTAQFSGGAVHAFTSSNLSWTGQTDFRRNDGGTAGGALHFLESAATFTGETTFAENFVTTTGGAVDAVGSNVSWAGVTSFQYSTTGGSDGGGTVHSFESVLSWRGKTSFAGGIGGMSGALAAYGSNVSWEGEISFCDNEAKLNGGALAILDSSFASWAGETLFCNNRVTNPGSYAVAGSGGALYVLDSAISWNGTTTFTNNSAESGGAVLADGVVQMAWGGTSAFVENTASANGGAVSLGTEVSLDLESLGTNLSFTGNVADVAGGALFMSGTSSGITWQGARFISNSALNGGAVYSIASGTFVERNVDYPTEYFDCTFHNNTAEASGGAIESAAGKDNFIDSTFEGNTAGELGGGLRLAGTTTLTGCDFVGNGAGEAGPAVANIGTVTVLDTSFSENSLICGNGDFLNYTVEARRK